MPLADENIEQVKIARPLGVVYAGNLNFDEHVTFALSICSQRFYLIKLIRSQGIPESKLRAIFVALIISRILYALPAWDGFLNSQQINRINAFLRKAQRFGFCSSMCVCDVLGYLRMADSKLFNCTQSPPHCLSHRLPPEKHHLGLRPRGHSYALHICPNNLCKRSFIHRSLFVFCDQCVCIVPPIVQHLCLSFVY